jgi:hypothetical protein
VNIDGWLHKRFILTSLHLLVSLLEILLENR